MSRIFITGDTHGRDDIRKLYPNSFPEQKNLTKDDYLIILGDAGIIWGGTKQSLENGYFPPKGCIIHTENDEKLIEWYNKQNYTTLYIDGNHENHKCLNSYPVEEWNGGKVHRISDSVFHLMRGEVFNIDGRTFFTMGGATSTDQWGRVEDIDWWREELPSENEIDNAIDNINKAGGSFDYILTHCCSLSIQNKLSGAMNITDVINVFFEFIESKIIFQQWYFGHFHRDLQIDNGHRCVYNDIIELP